MSEITAKIICDSLSSHGNRITTFELQYPRFIHSEFLTHRLFSRNSASSRAIPFNKMVEQLNGIPVRFGKNISGMQDSGSHNERIKSWDFGGTSWDFGGTSWEPIEAWNYAKENAVNMAKAFSDAGYHKQVFNRLTEPFQIMKTIVTATEFNNFFWLRNHTDADPTLAELARVMYEEFKSSKPKLIRSGQWHLPFVANIIKNNYDQVFIIDDKKLSIEDALKVSTARCAAVSFRNTDYPLDKCIEVYNRLLGSDRKHMSAFEHQATPMDNISTCHESLEDGVSHVDREGQLWSGNFKGWIQYRKLIPNENYTGEL